MADNFKPIQVGGEFIDYDNLHTNLGYDISNGSYSGHVTWSKIGFGSGVTAEQDIAPWLTAAYVWPDAEKTMTIVSSATADTAAGSGARIVKVYYLDDGFAEHVGTVTMTGTAPVTVATDMYRVNNARIATSGTSLSAVGNITIASGGITYGYITATKTRMRQCVWSVPYNKTLYVSSIAFSCADQAAGKYSRFTTRANFDEKSGEVLQPGLFMPFNEVVLNNTGYYRELNPPTKLPATTDLKVSVFANSAAVVTCTLRGWTVT